jgi:hypothetical protein
MHRKISIAVIIAGLLFIVGCTPFHETLTGNEKSFSPTQIENIKVYFPNEGPTTAFQEIGNIIVQKDNSKDAVEFLKEKTAKMGGDAIVDCEIRVYRYVATVILFFPIYENTFIASGTAVRYNTMSMKGD